MEKSIIKIEIDYKLKDQVETILNPLGISISDAINMFFKQIVDRKQLPFDIEIKYQKPISMSYLSKEELDNELQKGYADILEGKTKSFDEVLENLNNVFKKNGFRIENHKV